MMIHPDISMIHLQLPMEWPDLELTSTMTIDLIAYAEGKMLDLETKEALDRWLFDYADRDLEGEYINAADNLEALMRNNKNVAMLVSEKAREKRLHKLICAYVHDRLYGDEHAEIERMIESNTRLADVVEKLRLLKPHAEAAFRSLEDEPLSLKLLPLIQVDGRILESDRSQPGFLSMHIGPENHPPV